MCIVVYTSVISSIPLISCKPSPKDLVSLDIVSKQIRSVCGVVMCKHHLKSMQQVIDFEVEGGSNNDLVIQLFIN